MKFTDLIKEFNDENTEHAASNIKINEETIQEEEKKPEEILRGAGIKIKLVTPTSFGTQIDLAKSYDENEIKDLLKDYTIKLKNKSIFIVD